MSNVTLLVTSMKIQQKEIRQLKSCGPLLSQDFKPAMYFFACFAVLHLLYMAVTGLKRIQSQGFLGFTIWRELWREKNVAFSSHNIVAMYLYM